jgi:methylthioxylose transferase
MSSPAISQPRQLGPLVRRAAPVAVVAVVALTIAVGLINHFRRGYELGTPLPPFLMSWTPDLHWPVAIALVLAVGCAWAAPWAIERVRSGAAFATLGYVVTLAVGLAVAAARMGTAGWSHVFDLGPGGSFEAKFEYLPALPALRRGVAYYVGHFAQLLPGLPTHTKGNPPGPLVAMHLLGLTTPGRLAAACVVVGSLVTPLTYALGRSIRSGVSSGRAAGGASGDAVVDAERRGRVAATFAAFSPCVLIYGFTSFDFVFAAIGAAVAWLLVSRRGRVVALGCVAAGVAVFFSWVLLAIPAWAVVVVYVREGRGSAFRLAVGAAAGVVAVTLLLVAVWGYDPIAILRAVHDAYGKGAAAQRPYAFWLFGSPAAWITLLGPPIVWLALRSLQRGEPAAVALALIVLVSAVAGFTKAETERIWLPYVPLACAAAAASPIMRLRAALVAMALAAVAVTVLFGTTW